MGWGFLLPLSQEQMLVATSTCNFLEVKSSFLFPSYEYKSSGRGENTPPLFNLLKAVFVMIDTHQKEQEL